MSEAIEIQGVCHDYGATRVVSDLDLTVHNGELFALLGPNGAGKTTLLSLLTTLARPKAGAIRVLGYDVVRAAPEVRRRMGVVFQEMALEQRMSALDNLQLMARCYGLTPRAARARAEELLDIMGLSDLARQRSETLSGGQRRRLELARALVGHPRILFLDEATQGLDLIARQELWAQLRALVHQGCTVFFSTHDMAEAALADRAALMQRGRILACDTPARLQRLSPQHGLLLTSDNPHLTLVWLRQQGYAPSTREGGIWVDCRDAATELPSLLARIPGGITRVETRQASLETVFRHLISTSGESTP